MQVFLSGCNLPERQNAKQIVLSEVTFFVHADFSISKAEELENRSVFEFEGLWGELRDHRLVVMGKDYGEVNAGDEVQFKRDKTFLVNGSRRESAGLGDSAVESEEVLFFFPGRNVTQSTNEDGVPVVEMPDGATYEFINGGIVIDGHEYGPFSPATVVKIDSDGRVAYNP